MTDATKTSAWEDRHAARIAEIIAETGFDDAPDAAALIVRFFAAAQDRYSEDRADPVLGPIIQRAADRYGETRRYDFALANRIAMTEAVRAILALETANV